MDKKCLFCEISAGRVPAEIVYRDEDVIVIRDITPQAPVHLLVMPVEHVESSADVQKPEVWSKVMDCAAKTAARLGLDQDGYRLVINCGAQAGQTIPHLHIHLLAGRSFRWPPG
ncbi:MAG: histidine triad nucleotide-binding protein [Synergistaceae bacterium]|nr:histidine triad nucleotide-binding protein [Synergistaceae bacterium]